VGLKLVSAEDYAAILNLMGKYQHLVDDGDEEAWVELFTDDGAFLGLTDEQGNPADVRGREALKSVPRMNYSLNNGKTRHNMCSFGAEYGESRDEAFARYYVVGTVSPPGEPVSVSMEVDVSTHLVRIGGEWKIKSNRFTSV